MAFRTKLDFSDNRQVKQRIETIQELSGATHFGVDFSRLPFGPDLSTSGVSETHLLVFSTFTGNSSTTKYIWGDSRMSLGEASFSALTPSNSATTQTARNIFTANTSTTIDGNYVVLTYSGVNFSLNTITMIDLGGGQYSGNVITNSLKIISADTVCFTGRTIWADVSGITRTQKLIISKNPIPGYVWSCLDFEGNGQWLPSSGGTTGSSSIWSASTGTPSAVLSFSNNKASANYAVAEGFATIASGMSSHAEGISTIAGGAESHSEGNGTQALGSSSHAEGYFSIANGNNSHTEGYRNFSVGDSSHSEGEQTEAIGETSHTEGQSTTAIGIASHAGGISSIASGNTSFVHGNGSIAKGNSTIVLGDNISGISNNYTYVESLNIKTVGTTASVNQLRIDANGNLTTNVSDERLKENITNISNALTKIKNLQGVTYNWKDKSAGGDSTYLGFIAQAVEAVDKDLVFTNKMDGYKGIHIEGVIPLLVEAIKEISSGITTSGNVYLETQTILAEDNNIDLNYSGTSETAVGGGITILHAMGQDVGAKLVTDTNGNWVTNNDFKSKYLTIPFYTPSSSSDTNGNDGNISRDNNYIYVKTNDGWKRSNLESF
jgi:hypothetical protein